MYHTRSGKAPEHFYALTQRELLRGTRYADSSVVLMLDLDHFKEINDTFGHSAGDIVLKKVVETCKNGHQSIDITNSCDIGKTTEWVGGLGCISNINSEHKNDNQNKMECTI